MTKVNKLRKRFITKPKDFTWNELRSLLVGMGYGEFNDGKNSGSRVRFVHDLYGDIMLHKPHPNSHLKTYQVRQLLEQLEKEGLL